MGKTGRNGCGPGANGIMNEGIVPPSCRVSSLTAPASSMLILAATVDTTFSQPLTIPEQEIVQSTFKSHLETDYLWYSSLSLVFTVSMQSSRRNGMSTDNPSTNTSASGGPTDPPTAAPFVSCSLAAFLAEECVAYTLSAIAETNNPSAASATLTPGLSNDLAFGLSAALPGVTNSVGSVITSVTTASPTTALGSNTTSVPTDAPTTSASTTGAPTDPPTAAPTFALPGSCASCDLVPCGHCQEGCAESACTYESDVDKEGKSGRNGCGVPNGIMNEGIVPPACRPGAPEVPSPSPSAAPTTQSTNQPTSDTQPNSASTDAPSTSTSVSEAPTDAPSAAPIFS